ncbi:MAG TPA: patatin-like phospholipase family protein [Mycobacterium sp.]|nr:patatin-like phospholipase family protein [Mycobacterium sp.]
MPIVGHYQTSGTEPVQPRRVAVVVGGAGARGGYEAGALSVLVPRLRAAGCEPRVYVGSGAGAITATLYAASAHLPPAEQAQQVLDLWGTICVSEVYRSPLITLPGVAAHLVGQVSRLPRVRLTHLLDTAPLRRTVQHAIDLPRLRDNIADHSLTLAVVTTSGNDNRTIVFVDRDDGVPVPASDDERPLDYVGVRIQPEHVLASCAIPVLFPAVRVRKPSGSPGWYLDGRLRLHAPLKPALALDADALIVVATHPMRDTTTTPQAGGLAPDVDDILTELVDSVSDRMVEDVRTLDKINALVRIDELVATATGRLRKKIPYVFVGPAHSQTLGRLALEVLHRKPRYSGALAHRLRQLESRLMAHALKGDGPRRGDLVSYLYFDQEFLHACIQLGQRDANALLNGVLPDEVPWRVH